MTEKDIKSKNIQEEYNPAPSLPKKGSRGYNPPPLGEKPRKPIITPPPPPKKDS